MNNALPINALDLTPNPLSPQQNMAQLSQIGNITQLSVPMSIISNGSHSFAVYQYPYITSRPNQISSVNNNNIYSTTIIIKYRSKYSSSISIKYK